MNKIKKILEKINKFFNDLAVGAAYAKRK